MYDYWTTLLSHWAEKELYKLGYVEDPEETNVNVHVLLEVTTKCKVLFHWQGLKGRQNIIIPNDGALYDFLKDKPYRIANCVFLSKYNGEGEATYLFQVNNYETVLIKPEYLAYETASIHTIDSFDGCSMVEQNHQDLSYFQSKPFDLWDKVCKLFKL